MRRLNAAAKALSKATYSWGNSLMVALPPKRIRYLEVVLPGLLGCFQASCSRAPNLRHRLLSNGVSFPTGSRALQLKAALKSGT